MPVTIPDSAVTITGIRSNPYDGHTLAETIEQVGILAEQAPKTVIVDRGYRGVEVDGVRILRAGQKRGITRTLHAMIERRSAIEPTIGHMKTDGRLARNWLKGELGDALHAVLRGAGHNIRLLLKKRRLLFAQPLAGLLAVRGLRLAPPTYGRRNGELFRTDQVIEQGRKEVSFAECGPSAISSTKNRE
jgi:IS5 family transposase